VTGTFKANNPINNFLLLIYGVLLKLPIFLHPQLPKPQQIDGFLYKELLKWMSTITTSFPLLSSLLTFILLFTQAIALNKLVNTQRLFAKPHYLAGMSYLLITSLFTEWQTLSAPLIISSIAIGVLSKMSNLYNTQNAKTELFTIGITIGVGTFFYFPSIALLGLVFFGLILIRPFKLAEWLMALLGGLTPYYFLFAIVFLTDKWKGYSFPGVAITAPIFNQTKLAYIAIGLVVATALIGYFFVQQNFRRQLIQSRKSWSLIFLYLLIALIVPFINATNTFSYWVLCAAPFAVLVSGTFFYAKQRWLSLIIHWAMVALVIVLGYFLIK
jgi:Family of unknown function (DUF6427)